MGADSLQCCTKVNTLIVEDHSIVRWAIRGFLEEHGISVVGEAESVAEAIELTAVLEPDVVIMDISLGNESGIEATRQLAGISNSRIIALSAFDTQDYIEAFLNAGGTGFVSKAAPIKDIVSAITAATNNQQWISPGIYRSATTKNSDKNILSKRECEIVSLIAKGLSSRQISDRLYVSVKTVETHRYRVFKKLNIHNRAQLISYAIDNEFLKSCPAHLSESAAA